MSHSLVDYHKHHLGIELKPYAKGHKLHMKHMGRVRSYTQFNDEDSLTKVAPVSKN